MGAVPCGGGDIWSEDGVTCCIGLRLEKHRGRGGGGSSPAKCIRKDIKGKCRAESIY